jgi:hypothetical protein
MTLHYSSKNNFMLCPKCKDKAEWNDNGDLECQNQSCKYIYYMFSDKDNSFQIEFFSLDNVVKQ